MQPSSIPKRDEPRYDTALIGVVYFNKWNPMAVAKAIVLDLSWHGFKIEFIDKDIMKIKNGVPLTLKLPISQFNISTLRFLKLDIIVKWCDKENKRAGGVFVRPKGEKEVVLGNLIQKLAKLKQTEDDLDPGSPDQLSNDTEEAS